MTKNYKKSYHNDDISRFNLTQDDLDNEMSDEEFQKYDEAYHEIKARKYSQMNPVHSDAKYIILKDVCNTKIHKYYDVKTCKTRTVVLHRIKALRNINRQVRKGDIGGWVHGPENLSKEGSCWIFDEAMCFGDAVVMHDAQVKHEATIYDNAVIGNRAIVTRKSVVREHAIVCEYAHISGDDVEVCGRAIINKGANVIGGAYVGGNAVVTDYAKVGANAKVLGESVICGSANVAGHAVVWGHATVKDHAQVYEYAKVKDATIGGKTKLTSNVEVSGDFQITPEGEMRFFCNEDLEDYIKSHAHDTPSKYQIFNNPQQCCQNNDQDLCTDIDWIEEDENCIDFGYDEHCKHTELEIDEETELEYTVTCDTRHPEEKDELNF